MGNHIDDNKRIAKNTGVLYIRMLFVVIIGIYTSRAILKNLGVEDFGIYNVVGGIVTMLSFLNATLASSTQRFMTYALGIKDKDRLTKIFNTSLYIHIALGIIILILSETIGLWFLNNKLNIPNDRINSAFWVLQFSTLTCITSLFSVPYNSLIISYEKMALFTYTTIYETIGKLGIVLLIVISPIDKLIFYSSMLFLLKFSVQLFYLFLCKKVDQDACKVKWIFDKKLFKEMFSFISWSFLGSFTYIIYTQGLNILINIFYGPIVNAARAIACQIDAITLNFASNFQMSLNPQIVKSYASKDLSYMHSLIFRSAKFSFFILFIIVLPLVIEIDYILKLWLVEVPNYTNEFVALFLIMTLIDVTAKPQVTSIGATGKIKNYYIINSFILLLIVPISYITLKIGINSNISPTCVFIVQLIMMLISYQIRLLYLKKLTNILIKDFLKKVFVPIVLIAILSSILPILLRLYLPQGFIRLILVGSSCLLITIIVMYLLGLDKNEKKFVNNKINSLIKKND